MARGESDRKVDFVFTEEQDELRSLAAKVVSDHASPERLGAMERSGEPFDRGLWRAAADAGLLGAGIGDPFGGGMGLTGTCIVLEELGRHVAPLPLWAGSCVAGSTLDRYGTHDQRRTLLPGICSGSLIVTAALEDPLEGAGSEGTGGLRAEPDGPGWRLFGEKIAVPYLPQADRVMVAAGRPDGATGMFLLDPGSAGVTVLPGWSTTGEPLGTLELTGTRIDVGGVIGGEADEAASYAYRVGVAGLCATAAGVLAGGLRVTADYIAVRQQFGRPIASFQGPAMRIADAYIDVQAVWVAAWSAIWQLDTGRPAEDALAIAKFWVADGGQRAVHAFQHLHGGMGLDIDYPIHRYFQWAKALEVALGGASTQLERLGDLLAEEV